MNRFCFVIEFAFHLKGTLHFSGASPFHLAATAIGGDAWGGAGRIWYHALLDPATRSDTDFAIFARTTVDVAVRLHGPDGVEGVAVEDAWTAVGVI